MGPRTARINNRASVGALVGMALALAFTPAAGKAGESGCGTYPAHVVASLYSGWSGCQMKRDGHKPLWQGLPAGTAQVTRFVFTEGHGLFYRVITMTEAADGTANLIVSGSQLRRSVRQSQRRMAPRRVRLTEQQVARIGRLGEETGAWDFAEGSWDGDGIYMHCQVLDMERANVGGYQHSSVNIGCNKPQKSMPLVDEIIRLAGLQTAHGGMLYY